VTVVGRCAVAYRASSSARCEPSFPATEHAAKPANKATTSNNPRHLSIRSPFHVEQAERKALLQQMSRVYVVSARMFASGWFFLVKPGTAGSPLRACFAESTLVSLQIRS